MINHVGDTFGVPYVSLSDLVFDGRGSNARNENENVSKFKIKWSITRIRCRYFRWHLYGYELRKYRLIEKILLMQIG